MDYVPLIQSVITAAAILLAAWMGRSIYRAQKNLDRKQEEYRGYVVAFDEANFWNGLKNKHTNENGESAQAKYNENWENAQVKYHKARLGLLLVASKEVFDAVSEFHECYVSARPIKEKGIELKDKYAIMIAAMRKDGFNSAITTPEEVEKRIPWDV